MSYTPPQPDPKGSERARRAERIRRRAADLAGDRPDRGTLRNGEAETYDGKWPTSFTKGLPHDRFGIVEAEAFRLFFEAINAEPCSDTAQFRVPIGPKHADKAYRPEGYEESDDAVKKFCLVGADGTPPDVRAWESPRSGHVYDLEGPDADAVSMPPAPCLGSAELTAEMAEVYALALLRDVPFTEIAAGGGSESCGDPSVNAAKLVAELNKLLWFQGDRNLNLTIQERRRRRARFAEGETRLTPTSVFRGSAPGAKDGPYISQFLLIGSPHRNDPGDGKTHKPSERAFMHSATAARIAETADAASGAATGQIGYGTLGIDQRTVTHLPCLDYMTTWQAWLDVQNGANLKGTDRYLTTGGSNRASVRFMTTPRDLATYVHFDALYEAYLNACLLMASYGAPASAGFPSGPDHSTRDSFATFGVPHVLSLVTEVATRALKAVRRQKFNYHLRTRPEGIGGLLTLAGTGSKNELGNALAGAEKTLADLSATHILDWIQAHNTRQNKKDKEHQRVFSPGTTGCDEPPAGWDEANALLPMAFPEGSPMHAAYGAGHATVAGACVTILKAFFELYEDPRPAGRQYRDPLSSDFQRVDYLQDSWWRTKLPFTALGESDFEDLYVPTPDGSRLVAAGGSGKDVDIIGELNKLAANISIGRNMAGVHYYTDYYDSLRLGERIAAGILQEQMLTYPETMSMRFESFDGDQVVFENKCRRRGRTRLRTYVRLADENGRAQGAFEEDHFDTWWCRPSDGLENARRDSNPKRPCHGRPLGGEA